MGCRTEARVGGVAKMRRGSSSGTGHACRVSEKAMVEMLRGSLRSDVEQMAVGSTGVDSYCMDAQSVVWRRDRNMVLTGRRLAERSVASDARKFVWF